MEAITRLASQNVVVIFSVSSCFMCLSIKRLFYDLGVSPAVHEIDQEPRGKEMEKALANLLGRRPSVPAIFIGGRLIGSIDQVMSLHLSGSLVPLLKREGALWL
ncbi:glutaredoxin-C1-like [Aristolochia californica]|uniref:glutaredoxin-C1-like n=1 Tax=Aristolochia californica TaxID=171875 RepID=UPI0035D57CF8